MHSVSKIIDALLQIRVISLNLFLVSMASTISGMLRGSFSIDMRQFLVDETDR